MPQQFSLPQGTERYVVEGAGAILVPVYTGDHITIINDEGGQVCEVIAADAKGKTDTGIVGETANATAEGLRDLLISDDQSLRGLRIGLDVRKIDLASAKAVRFFNSETRPKAEQSLIVQRDGSVIIATLSAGMDIELQDTATPLTVMVKRATLKSRARFELPDPLADMIQDIRVHTQTAESYFVKAGEYIQIIDVDGRQCTDFECFSARKLDKGIEHALDVTTTRTLMGHAYPMPGLHAKYYDQEMLPLVEVVQDTCGRHDAFALACSAKYYDDIGYPGHVNCSDNFNHALDKYGVMGRPGWMAINFFFNTGLDNHGVMYTDEPWSMPGDYVCYVL
jgi:aminomethyltransferase